jgi:hypothetical protein
MKADLHIHSNASSDALVDPVQILKIMKERGFGAVAILDHNSVKGSMAARRQAKEIGIIVVRGTEVSSSMGHIGALRVEEEIPKGLSPQETVDRIHGMGGLAVALHPYRMSTGIGEKTVRSCKFDAVETRNGFTSRRKNVKAQALAESLRLPCTAGSDGHREEEFGRIYLDIPECGDEEELLKSILAGKGSPQGDGLSISGSLVGSLELTAEWMRRGFHRL